MSHRMIVVYSLKMRYNQLFTVAMTKLTMITMVTTVPLTVALLLLSPSVTEAIHSISSCASQEDSSATMAALTGSLVQLEDVDVAASDRYHDRLKQALQEKGDEVGGVSCTIACDNVVL